MSSLYSGSGQSIVLSRESRGVLEKTGMLYYAHTSFYIGLLEEEPIDDYLYIERKGN